MEQNRNLPNGLLYRLVWRWHFYAGLFVAPFAVLLAVTGSLYLFQPQIENILYARLYNVPVASASVSPDAQLKAVRAAFPGGKPLAYLPPVSTARSAIFRIYAHEGRQMLVAVNPHDGTVLGAIDDNKRFMQIVREMHGKLLSGAIGQGVMELAASWVMVLLITGLYLWWPRGRGLVGAALPRLNAGGRGFWRDLHAVTGFWLSLFLVFMVLSGLPWSLVAGKAIKTIEMYAGGAPQTGMGWDGGGSRDVKSETTHQGWTADHAMHMAGMAHSVEKDTAHPVPLTLTQVAALAENIPDLVKPYSIYFPVDAHGVYSISSVQANAPETTAYIHIDQYTGKIIREVRWKDFSPLAKSISIGVSLHEGQYFGLANQLANLAICLSLIGLVGAGIMMWWKRRPPGRLGVPKAPEKPPVGKGIIAIIIALGLLMPLMGASVVIILTGEWVAGRWGSSAKFSETL